MGCETWREALSARLDGECSAADASALDFHLAGCAECAAWSARLDRLHRSARVAPADDVPDLTDAILVAAGRRRLPYLDLSLVLRWLLVVIGAVEIGMAAPELSGRWHAGGELGTWAVASAVGLLSVAHRPSRAGAVLPMLCCAGLMTAYVSLRDIAGGAAMFSSEWPHLLLICGVIVLAVLWHRERSFPAPGPDVRVASGTGSRRERHRRAA
jgi:predicted anti-sigma-YlaC factor YlaD